MYELRNTRENLHTATDESFLSLLLPKRTVRQLLAEHEKVYEAVLSAEECALAGFKSAGEKSLRNIEILREFLSRWQAEKTRRVKSILCPGDAFDYLTDMQQLRQEQLRVIILNAKNNIILQRTIFQGTINSAPVCAREIFHPAVQHLAAGIILAHNHPSGDSTPSDLDVEVTKPLIQSGNLLGIAVLDHIVIGKGEYSSLKEKSLLSAL